MNDKETVRILKSGKVNGLEFLIDKYYAYVGTIIRRIVLPVLSESDVEELAADVFAAVWKSSKVITAEDVDPTPLLITVLKKLLISITIGDMVISVKYQKGIAENLPLAMP